MTECEWHTNEDGYHQSGCCLLPPMMVWHQFVTYFEMMHKPFGN